MDVLDTSTTGLHLEKSLLQYLKNTSVWAWAQAQKHQDMLVLGGVRHGFTNPAQVGEPSSLCNV